MSREDGAGCGECSNGVVDAGGVLWRAVMSLPPASRYMYVYERCV